MFLDVATRSRMYFIIAMHSLQGAFTVYRLLDSGFLFYLVCWRELKEGGVCESICLLYKGLFLEYKGSGYAGLGQV